MVSAGVVIPDGYGAALDAGEDATVALVADPTSTSAAAVQAGVRATVGDRAAVVAAGRAAAGEGADPDVVAAARQEAAALAPNTPAVGVRTVTVDDGGEVALGDFDYTAPSNLVLFTFVNTLVAGTALASERRQGITRRMLATPHGTGTILARPRGVQAVGGPAPVGRDRGDRRRAVRRRVGRPRWGSAC